MFVFQKAVLSSKPEGDSKVSSLRRQSDTLCEQEELEEGRKQEVQHSVRETEEQWRAALQTAEEVLNKAVTQVQLDRDFDAFRTQNETVQSWIRDQEQNLQSLSGCMQVKEKAKIAQVSLKWPWSRFLIEFNLICRTSYKGCFVVLFRLL